MRKPVFTALFLSTAFAAIPAFAQVTEAPPPAADVPAGEEIVVVGTRAQGRTVAESPVPVDVITGDALVNAGYTETNRFGNTLSPGGSAATDVELTPKWLTDVEIRATPGQFELAIGANNLFDVYPTRNPILGAAAINNYFIPYSSFSPFGFNGRYLYARAGVKF